MKTILMGFHFIFDVDNDEDDAAKNLADLLPFGVAGYQLVLNRHTYDTYIRIYVIYVHTYTEHVGLSQLTCSLRNPPQSIDSFVFLYFFER